MKTLKNFIVPTSFVGLLYEDGAFARLLEPGKHDLSTGWFQRIHREVKLVDLRERSLVIKGQEILTKDKVAIRVSLLVYFRVVDAEDAVHNVAIYEERIYEDVQLAARRFLASRPLDAILSDRNEISDAVREAVQGAAAGYGVEIIRADVKDLVFPGNLREIMNRVLETERRAEAQLIDARKEAEALTIKAEAQRAAELQRLQSEKERIRLTADAEREKLKLELESAVDEARALVEHPELLKLRQLEVLRGMAKDGAKFVMGLKRAPAVGRPDGTRMDAPVRSRRSRRAPSRPPLPRLPFLTGPLEFRGHPSPNAPSMRVTVNQGHTNRAVRSPTLHMIELARSGAVMALMVATVAWPSSTDAADIAYAWADRESDPFSYVANEQYAYTSSDHIKVTREGVGYYVVDFGVLLGVGGNVQVSMYGSDTGHCSLRFWTHSRAHVQCYDILRRPADRKFSILAINAEPSDAGDLIYAWLDRSSAPSPYQPSASYRFDNGTLRVDNDSPGDYQPFWSPGLRAATLVTPYGSSANCRHIDGSSTRTWFRCEAPTRASLLLVADSFPGTSFARWNRSTGSVSGWTSDGSAQSRHPRAHRRGPHSRRTRSSGGRSRARIELLGRRRLSRRELVERYGDGALRPRRRTCGFRHYGLRHPAVGRGPRAVNPKNKSPGSASALPGLRS